MTKIRGIVLTVLVLGVLAMAAIGILFGDNDSLLTAPPLSHEDAKAQLAKALTNVTWREERVGGVEPVPAETADLDATLPPINTFPMVVTGGDGVTAELFVSTEKSGSGPDGWMVEAANAFNAARHKLGDGRVAQIAIRKIDSGTGYQFIGSRQYVPDGFSPSNHLWVRMVEGRGVKVTAIREKTVGNIAGVVLKDSAAQQIRQRAGKLDIPVLLNEVVERRIAAGYTNPFASSTGLNFLVTVLASFAEGDEARMLSPEVTSAFEAFQRGVPFVAMTTIQMRDSVRRDGSLDAFVMEYQTFAKTPELQTGYTFLPFGVPHDNPLYAVGDPGSAKMEVLRKFGTFLDGADMTNLARQYGFNPNLPYDAPFKLPAGKTLIEAQKLWKQKKDAGRRIAAVFIADTSGSMEGSRLQELRRALLEGSSFISPQNSIGLVAFSDDVRILLPPKPFNLLQKSAFRAAVKSMRSGGTTAMYSAVAVGLKILLDELAADPDVKPMLFVLTDGVTNAGLEYSDMARIIEGLRIPVYTIGFEADINELQRLSSAVEAATINAAESDLRYKIGAMLNAQM